MSQKIISEIVKRRAALCYAENMRQQKTLVEKSSATASEEGETVYLPSYVSIVVRAVICLVLIGGLMYGVNHAMAAWLA